MKLFTGEQIRQADAYTIANEPIESIDLMERAARMLAENIAAKGSFFIFCGLGNNGGDGLALARLLTRNETIVNVIVINYSDKRSDDFKTNFKRLLSSKSKNSNVIEINSIEELKAINLQDPKSIIVDALLGIGTNKPTEGLLADAIKFINNQNRKVISIDIPSGLYADGGNKKEDVIVLADETLTFQFPKFSFMFPENSHYIGEYKVLDIGLSSKYINETKTNYYLTTLQDVKPLLKKRNKIAHKGNFGHALIVAGSYGKMGAAVLAVKACMHSGAGLVTAHIPKCGYTILQTTVPEAMADADTEENYITDNLNIEKYNAIGVGPGIGIDKQTGNVLKLLIQNSSRPIVFDADALNILSENKTWFSFLPPQSILTPHIKEWERIVGKVSSGFERLKQQQEFSIKYNVYIILKGSNTSISLPTGEVFFNSTGNPGMAKGGSGDVLTGLLTSLLAQGYTSFEACILGAFLHGAAGDFASLEKTEETMTASDIIEYFTDAFKYIRS